MSVFSDLINNLKSSLSQYAELSDVKFVNADINESVPNPIKKIYVSLGINNISISDGSFNSYLGLTSTGEQYGNLTEMSIELKIFSPKNTGAIECYTVLSKIYEYLFYQNKTYNVSSISCDKAVYNNDIFSFVLTCELKLKFFIERGTEEVNISNIKIKKV